MTREEQTSAALKLLAPPSDECDECRRHVERALDIVAAWGRAAGLAGVLATKKERKNYATALRRAQSIAAKSNLAFAKTLDKEIKWIRHEIPAPDGSTITAGWSPPAPWAKEKTAVARAHELLIVWRCWHSVTEKRSSKGRCNKASDKCCAPGTISRLRIDKTGKNSADTGDPASECHKQDSGKPDQCTADRSRDWSEIAHSLRHLHAANIRSR
jgi:hypothetical protein